MAPNFQGGHIVRKANVQASTPTKDLPELGLRQLWDATTGICTYLVWDKTTDDAILINPVDTETARDLTVASSLHLCFVINTHGLDRHHAICVGTRRLKQQQHHHGGVQVVVCQGPALTQADVDADLLLEDDDVVLEHGDQIHFGTRHVTAMSTASPSTPGNTSLLLDDGKAILTGSPLLTSDINGRCDVPAVEALFWMTLPDETIVFPGYCRDDDEAPRSSTVRDETQHNPFVLLAAAANVGTEPLVQVPVEDVERIPIGVRTHVKEKWGIFG